MSSEAPEDRGYTESHEWAAKQDGVVAVGITDFAVRELGDLVFIELPEIGDTVHSGEPFGEIESVKAVSELLAPVSGEVVEVNSDLTDALDTLVDSPFEDGWLIKVKIQGEAELGELMSAADYKKQLTGH